VTKISELFIVPGSNAKPKIYPLRSLGSEQLGGLVTVTGVVTRTSEVKPCILCACYACDVCGAEMIDTVPGETFMPRIDCESEACKTNQVRGKVSLQIRGSKFTSQQEIRIQESSDQVPMGHVPRTMFIHARGETTRQCSPGDYVTVTGVYSPKISEGRTMTGDLQFGTQIEAYKIEKAKKSFSDALPEEVLARIQKERGPDIYERVFLLMFLHILN